MSPPIKNEPPKPSVELEFKQNTAGENMIPASAMSKLIADAVAEALKVAIPAAAIGINAANLQSQQKLSSAQVRDMQRKLKRCPICALPETACGGAFKRDAAGNDIIEKNEDGSDKLNYKLNHVLAYVGPADQSLFKWFQGFYISGVRFLPDYYGHQMWIPKKSDILTNVNNWERNEKELSQKRSAEGMGAGAVGANGQVLNRGAQGALGWR